MIGLPRRVEAIDSRIALPLFGTISDDRDHLMRDKYDVALIFQKSYLYFCADL